MAKITLDNLSNEQAFGWLQDHFHYLPEAMATVEPKGYVKDWAKTLYELTFLLEGRGFDVRLSITERKD